LLIAASSGILAFFNSSPFMTAVWRTEPVPVIGKLGTPVMFDFGVYLLVIGVTLTIIFSLAESE
jgi:multicomponent Na+:H+ antiporter subunit B